jgi:hypothetical protein
MSLNATSFKPSMVSDVTKKMEPKLAKADESKGLNDNGLDSLTLSSNFTPSTPYIHKFRTELCKNWSMYGKCKYGDECSFAHTKNHMMIKTDVSVLYKTKLCKKYSTNGYCPYGIRCQFIHDASEANIQPTQKT